MLAFFHLFLYTKTTLGSPVADIARFLVIDADGPTRQAIEPLIPELYLDCLRSQTPSLDFTEDQIEKLYYRSFVTQVCNFIGITNFTANTLQRTIDNDNDVDLNSARKEEAIQKAIHAIEDAVKVFEKDLAGLNNELQSKL